MSATTGRDQAAEPRTPNYVLWILATMLVTAGFVFAKRAWQGSGTHEKDKVFNDAGDYLRERQSQVRKPTR